MNENSAARGGLLDDQNSSATRMNAQSDATTCALPEAMNNPLPKLAKSDTVALWHAVNWMETVLREWHRGGFRDEQDRAQHEAQKQILINARKALRKVNKIRRGQP